MSDIPYCSHCNLLYHHVIIQITVSHFVSNIFCGLLIFSLIYRVRICTPPPPPVNPFLVCMLDDVSHFVIETAKHEWTVWRDGAIGSTSHESWNGLCKQLLKFSATLFCPSKQFIDALRFSIGKWLIILNNKLTHA